jgi:hypothetical protein
MVLSPITESVIKLYNADQQAATARAAETAALTGGSAVETAFYAQGDKLNQQAGQQAQMAENYIKLADILF